MRLDRRLRLSTTCIFIVAVWTVANGSAWAQAKTDSPKRAQAKPPAAKPSPAKSEAASQPAVTPAPAFPLRRLASEQTILFLASQGWNTSAADPASETVSTNHTERLLSDRSVQKFGTQLFAEIKKTLESGTRQSPVAALLLETVPTLLQATVQHPTVFAWEDFTTTESPDIRLAVVVDTESDADQVRAALEKLIAAVPKDGPVVLAQETIEGATFYHPHNPRVDNSAMPRFGMFKSYLILTMGSDMTAQTMKKIQGADQSPAWLDTTLREFGIDRPKLVWRLNVDAIKQKVEPLISDPRVKIFLNATGLLDLTQISCVVGLDAVDCVSKLHIQTSGEPRGLLNLIAGAPLAATDLKSIPANAIQVHLLRLDLDHVIDELLTIAEQTTPDAQRQFENVSERVKQELGFSLIDDFFPAFGDLWCCYVSGTEGGGLIPGLVVTATLRDVGKLQTVQDHLAGRLIAGLQQAGPRAPINLQPFATDDYGGYQVQFTQLPLPIAPTWIICEKGLIFGLTPQLVTAHVAAAEAKTSFADLNEIQPALKHAPAPMFLSFSNPRPQVLGAYTLINLFSPVVAAQLMQQGIQFNFPPLPPFSTIEPHLSPSVTTLSRLPKGWAIDSHGVVPSIGTALPIVAATTGALMVTQVGVARGAARRTQNRNNLRQLALAMHNFHDTSNRFPARVIADESGKPGLSWRVQLLPLLGEQALYDEFHLDEPWDSEHNKALIKRMPPVYGSPEDPELVTHGKTRYVAPRGKGFLFDDDEGPSIQQITDGTSNTIMIVEADAEHAVTWTQPEDLEIDLEAPLKGLRSGRPQGFDVAMADGAIRPISNEIEIATLIALFTRAGGEIVGDF